MKTKEEITEYLVERLSYIYCYSCANDGKEYVCDECHRKSMNWQLSEEAAKQIADDILKE